MKSLLSLLKKLASGAVQLAVVAGFFLTALVAYNLGAGSRSAPAGEARAGAASSPASRPASRPATAHPADLDGDGVFYTCSMHPQIQQDEPGDCPICGMDLVAVEVEGELPPAAGDHAGHAAIPEPELLGYACAMNCVPPLEEEGDCPICGMEMQPVFEDMGGADSMAEGDPARRLSMSREARALASIQTSPVVRYVPRKTIRLVGELAVSEDRLAHISADAGGRIDELAADYEGDVVQQGEELVLLYSPELLAVQREFLQAKAAVDRLPGGTLETVRRASESAVEAARERLRLAGLSAGQIDAIAASGEARERVTLTAPIGGTVIERHAQEGQYVGKGERLLTIASLERLWAELAAYESDLPWLRVGQPVTFTTKAFPGETFNGEVAWIDPVTDARTRTTRVRLDVENEGARLRPGMYLTARVESTLGEEPELLIPASAPLITGERAVVYLEVPDAERPTYQGVEVVLGPRTQDGYVVKEGLAEGQRVVTNGAFQIDSALQIVAKPSMMNPAGGMVMAGHDHGQAMPMAEEETAPAAALVFEDEDDLAAVLRAYLTVQRALANDDPEGAREAFQAFAQVARDQGIAALRDPAEAGAKEESLDKQRPHFETLSLLLIPVVQEQGNPLDVTLQLTNCPMAFDWKGADWLQSEEDVFNPYFGDEMLTCGQIMQEWAAHD